MIATTAMPNSGVACEAKILVAVCSAREHAAMRLACRETWAAGERAAITVRFFVGGGPFAEEPDTVGLLVSDDPRETLIKLMVIFREALDTWDFDWLFKCDDSAYVDLERLPELIRKGTDLIGGASLWEHGALDGKAGYFIAKKMLVKLLKHGRVMAQANDDGLIGREILRLGGTVSASARLRGGAKPYPRADNDLISAHCTRLSDLRAIHTLRQSWPAEEWEVEQMGWKDTLLVHKNGTFARKASYCIGRLERDERSLILRWHDWGAERLVQPPDGTSVDYWVRGMDWNEGMGHRGLEVLIEMTQDQKEAELIRYGPHYDGGYLLPDGVIYDKVITIGVGNDIGFEVDYANSHPTTRFDLFDHTVSGLPEPLKNAEFHGIGVGNAAPCLPIQQLLTGRIKPGETVLLKMDCEGAEWNCGLEHLNCDAIHTFVLEIHHLLDPNGEARRGEILKAIASQFVLVHIHPNNYSRSGQINGRSLSDCIELTLVHRDKIGALRPRTQEKRPDFDNAPHLPPVLLNLILAQDLHQEKVDASRDSRAASGDLVERVVFSLSTSPTRIKTIAPTIYSLLDQSRAPERIYVNCPWVFQRTGESFALADLAALEQLAPEVIVINRCEDIGPISKLLPTLELEEDPDTLIVILDDDNRYSHDLLERMISACADTPEVIYANHVWRFEGVLDLAEGWGGVGIRRGLVDLPKFREFVHAAIRHHDCYRSDDLVMSYFFQACRIPVKRCPNPVTSEILQSINGDAHALSKQDQVNHAVRYRRSLDALVLLDSTRYQ